MTIIAETILAMTVLCTAPNRKRSEQHLHFYTSGNVSHNYFQISSGMSLERKLNIELGEIEGVQAVAIKRSGNVVEVNVVLETLEFTSFQKVTQKEIDLFERFPGMDFEFNVVPSAALEETQPVLHAA